MISAVILTKNEEKNIIRCLQSLKWCDEIIVVDDYSEDGTVEKMENGKWKMENGELKIFKRHLNGDFAAQRNFGLEKARGEWILFIDADEVISEELASEIQNQISNPETGKIVGFYIRRKDYFLGRWLRYGETGNIRLLRLGRKERGEWKGKIHEVWRIKGKIGQLQNPIYHYSHRSVSSFLGKINRYTDIVAQYWKEQGRKIHAQEIICYPSGKFIQNYFIRGGFLDGVPGLIMAVMMSFHSFLARGKLWQINHRQR